MEAGVTTLRSYVLGRDADPDAVAALPLLMAFEVMYCDGRDLGRPLRDRRARLECM
jgi:ATP-dependent DNA ligase